ncbi:MAG: hypothetical protein ACFWUH_02415 [Limosilactobacillus fermentum]|jgi:uncharacterized membrane protein
MKSLKSLWQRADRRLWVLSILIGFVVTWLVNIVPFINKVERFAVFYLLLYGAFAIWTGFNLQNRRRCWQAFVFPVSFLLAAHLFGPKYSLYFAPAYLAVAYLAWSMVRANRNK